MAKETKVISTINLKGGVGKTHITVALAEFLSWEFDEKVLVIDLDPQTNATVYLMTEENWLSRDNAGQTLAQLFKDKLEGTSKFNIKEAIVKKVSNVNEGIPTLDLLPSSLGLIGIQDRIPSISSLNNFAVNPANILKEAIGDILKGKEYDYILIDCPPNLGLITLNGLCISNYYLIPVIPDILSTWGISTIVQRINMLNEQHKLNVDPLGIIISMYRGQSKLHQSRNEELRKTREIAGRLFPRVFDTVVHLSTSIAESAEATKEPKNLKQKYGYDKRAYDNFYSLTEEVRKYAKK